MSEVVLDEAEEVDEVSVVLVHGEKADEVIKVGDGKESMISMRES